MLTMNDGLKKHLVFSSSFPSCVLRRSLACFNAGSGLAVSVFRRLGSARGLRAPLARDRDGDFDVHVAVQANGDVELARLLDRLLKVYASAVDLVALLL